MKTIAKLVDDLFRTHRRPDGREYTYKEISVALGGVVEPSHISKLRTGKIANPGRDTLLSLCRFFHVPPAYFFPELLSQSQEDETDMIHIALRSTKLDSEVQEKLENLIRAIQQKT